MDKRKQYAQFLTHILQEYAAECYPVNLKEVENQLLIDEEKGHYVLISFGWDKKRFGYFSYTVLFHFDIKENGKIWLIENNTDRDIAEELELLGVPPSDIVIANQPIELRKYMRYAEQ